MTLSNNVGAGNPNRDAMPFIRADIAHNPHIFPAGESLARLAMIRDFEPRMRRALSRMWTEIKVH